MGLLESGADISRITIMIQDEVADRLTSAPGADDYGAITAVLAYYGAAEKLFDVSHGNFLPAPKVDSAVIRIRLYKERPYHPKDEALMFRTIKAAFAQRRKTLSNALSAGFSELSKEQIKRARGEGGAPFTAFKRGAVPSHNDPVCVNCWAKKLCRLGAPHGVMCELERKCAECVMMVEIAE